MKKTIKELKKGDTFVFNGKEHLVTKRYVDDDHPLKATTNDGWDEHLFHNEELEVEMKDVLSGVIDAFKSATDMQKTFNESQKQNAVVLEKLKGLDDDTAE